MSDARPAFPPGLGVAVAVLSVSFAAPLFKLAHTGAVTSSFWRLAVAVLLLLPFTWGSWSKWATWHARDWWLAAIAGIALGAHFALWVTSLFMTTVAASTTLVTLQAVFVALGAHFVLGDRLSRRAWQGVGIATLGAMAITATDGSLAPDSRRAIAGDLLALLAGACSAVYFLVGRNLRARRGLVEYVTPVYAVAALALLATLPLVDQPLATGLPLKTFGIFVLLAAVPMLGGHTVANWCLKYLPAHVVSTWILLEPVGAALLAWPILHEVPSPWTAVGAAFVLFGAWMTIPVSSQSKRPMASEPAG